MKKNDGPGPLLVAVWPGMGQVALTAGYYLMTRLHMHETDPLPAQDLFDVDQVEVEDGLVKPAKLPKARLFLWKDPAQRRDIVVLIGEAQPPAENYEFCERLLDYVEERGVREVYTFAAMADNVPLGSPSHVFGVSTNPEGLDRLRSAGVGLMESGRITGLNGVLLGVAADRGLKGVGLLGEMPAMMSPIPFAKASAAVLQVFSRLSGVDIDLAELEAYGRSVESQLESALKALQGAMDAQQQAEEVDLAAAEPTEEEAVGSGEPEKKPATRELKLPVLSPADIERIEGLFLAAERKRTRAFELKQELDRLGAFPRYENRFLDLFRKPPDPPTAV